MFKKILAIILLSGIGSIALANDLDDGLGIDEDIDDKLQLNKNVAFIRRAAKAKAASGKAITNDDTCGTGNQVIGQGSTLKNVTIVNLSKNRNINAACGK